MNGISVNSFRTLLLLLLVEGLLGCGQANEKRVEWMDAPPLNYGIQFIAVKPEISATEMDTLLALHQRDSILEASVATEMHLHLERLNPERISEQADLEVLNFTLTDIGTFCKTEEECRKMLATDLKNHEAYFERFAESPSELTYEYLHFRLGTDFREFWSSSPAYTFSWDFWEAVSKTAPELEVYFSLGGTPFEFFHESAFDPYEVPPLLIVSDSEATQILWLLDEHSTTLGGFKDFEVLRGLVNRQVKGKCQLLVQMGSD